MKIAVPYENETIFPHFGHTQTFKLYEAEDGAVTSTQTVETMGSDLSGFLVGLEVDTLICGSIGKEAQDALTKAGIRLYGGVSGSADEAVEDLLTGKLVYDPAIRCSHQDHPEGHRCKGSSHSCGGKNCQ